jgi:hypothetical protein
MLVVYMPIVQDVVHVYVELYVIDTRYSRKPTQRPKVHATSERMSLHYGRKLGMSLRNGRRFMEVAEGL